MMISVMNNDFDSERNSQASEADEPRVSNDGSGAVVDARDVRVDDLNSNGGVRVYPGHDLGARKSEIDEIRVLPVPEQEGDVARVLGGTHCCAQVESGKLGRTEVSSENDNIDGDREMEFKVRDEKSGDGLNEVVNPKEVAIRSSHERTDGSVAGNFDALSGGNQSTAHNYLEGQMHDLSLERSTHMQASEGGDVVSGNMNAIVRIGSIKILGSAFEMGDMVWGKVKSHPWWPGHIYNQAFAFSSVQRTRRDGHVLVAFFGDSSYGWFDPTELISYDPHYTEKSQQTNSRNFMKAVEESVDEASRRSALGLSCRCRNPCNFRPANVAGYFAVDVVDYEPGAIYSVSQIQKARENFKPAAILSFIKQLAATPRSNESKSLDFIKHKATALAYRRSTFEEFDETYAQAFGQEPVRPCQLPLPPIDKKPSRAPLSGPLVIAEALGGKKSSTKAAKPKDRSKKDRYLFKRRDEVGSLRASQINQVHASSSSSSAYEDGTSDSVTATYVFQKRDHAFSTDGDLGGMPTRDQVATSGHHMATKDAPSAGRGVAIGSDVSGKRSSCVATGSSQQLELSAALTAQVTNVRVQDSGSQLSNNTSTDTGLVKKKKVGKRPAGERGSEKCDVPEKKKTKLRKPEGERSVEHSEMLSSGSTGTYMVKPAGRPLIQTIASSKEDFQVINWNKDNEVRNPVPQQVGSEISEVVEENEDELPKMLADLLGLALNPFHGAERNRPAIAQQLFLKFRSLVFLKATSALSTCESEPFETQAVRSMVTAELADKLPNDGSKIIPSMKPLKHSARNEDATRRGRKRLPSERLEEIAVKRTKKINKVKSMGAEKRATLKNTETLRVDGKVKVVTAQQPSLKPLKGEQQSKKVDRPPRVEEPTYLILKFQSGSSLPSLVELKARFARFGPMDTSLSRVFYKTNTCRVAFLYKQDANVAYRYAVGSKSVFSNVKFMLKPVVAPEPQQPSSGRAEDLHVDLSSNRDSPAVEPRAAVPATPLMQQQPVQQLKSCLKKPSGGDEPTGPTNSSGSVRTPRVRFNMGEDKVGSSNRGVVQMQMEYRNPISSSSEGGPCSSPSSSVAMDVSNNQRFMSSLPLQSPPVPHPPHLHMAAINHPQHQFEVAPRNNFNYNLAATTWPPCPGLAPSPPTQVPAPTQLSIDISQQMMTLLTRCHDVVTNVKSILGYVPYHPL